LGESIYRLCPPASRTKLRQGLNQLEERLPAMIQTTCVFQVKPATLMIQTGHLQCSESGHPKCTQTGRP